MPEWRAEKHDGYERDIMIETPKEVEARKRAEAMARFDPAAIDAFGQALVQRTLENAQLKQALDSLGREVVALKLKGGV